MVGVQSLVLRERERVMLEHLKVFFFQQSIDSKFLKICLVVNKPFAV